MRTSVCCSDGGGSASAHTLARVGLTSKQGSRVVEPTHLVGRCCLAARKRLPNSLNSASSNSSLSDLSDCEGKVRQGDQAHSNASACVVGQGASDLEQKVPK